jgi:deoxycytidine triphosphate deaminase
MIKIFSFFLPQLEIETADPAHPFNEQVQIQPCSIDIRLSDVFWLPQTRKSTIDLRRSNFLEISPRRHWKKVILKSHECRIIKPGQMLLGRTYEKFSMPNDCAGKLEGRSSFARMGLSIHATGDFINPGWRGHMPIQLINHGPHSIKVFPFIPICQLIFVKISSLPDRKYGDPNLQSKYMDDDGGPSYWWRDKRIQNLHSTLGKFEIGSLVQEQLINVISIQEPQILERFESYLDKLPLANLDSSNEILSLFAKSEDRSKKFQKVIRWSQGLPFALLGGLSIRLLLDPTYHWYYYLIWVLTLVSVLLTARILTTEEDEYLGEKELSKALIKIENQPKFKS